MDNSKNGPRKILATAKTGALICIGIAETACNLPLPRPGPVSSATASGGEAGLDIPNGGPPISGAGGADIGGAAGANAIGGVGGVGGANDSTPPEIK